MKRRILIWHIGIGNLINGGVIGGIDVQLYFWAKSFIKDGWETYTLTDSKDFEREQIKFLRVKKIKHINPLLEWFNVLLLFLKIRPNVVIIRGATYSAYPCVLFAKILKIKAVFFGASDVNFVPGKEYLQSDFHKKFYQKAIKLYDKIIVQNSYQKETLYKNYGKKSLQMFNIWGNLNVDPGNDGLDYDIVWIANMRRLKRAEWFIEAARRIPNLRFAMAGNVSDEKYFDELKSKIERIDNLDYLGVLSFFSANKLAAKSKILVCTSEFEGFPNTFLQAWSGNVPVISTIDPSGIIEKNNLGVIVDSIDTLVGAITNLMNDECYYSGIQRSVEKFFKENFTPESALEKFKDYVGVE